MSSHSKIAEALQLAEAAHRGQFDKLGVDYIEHVKAVAHAVRHLGEKYEITGLLHDSLEDCEDRAIEPFAKLLFQTPQAERII
ncbi:MAG: hypothetical protein LBU11_01355 [Zoogloeaceae bacterium]|nr:hypothetical protein [Zoogloeaceae bacterium]